MRTEAFVTIVVPESRIGRDAKECGGGFDGRARVLYGLMAEVEAHLRGGIGMSQVRWLTSPSWRRPAAPGSPPATGPASSTPSPRRAADAGVNADVPWAMAGPSGADPLVRHYSHDAWNSVSRHHQAARQGRRDGCAGAGAHPG